MPIHPSMGVRVAIAIAVIAGSAAMVPTATAQPRSTGDPASNTQPTSSFYDKCQAGDLSRGCIAVALSNFDRARAKDGLGPMTLPTDFKSLSFAERLLTLTDIDRVDHGVPAIPALATQLDQLAQEGANNYTDPPETDNGAGNWAGDDSALLSEYLWMYDDGLGSLNYDCTQSSTAGCWGHRHNVLRDYGPGTLMGAAGASSPYKSSAEEFAADYTSGTRTGIRWATIARLFPLGLATHSLKVSRSSPDATLRLWASGAGMKLTSSASSSAWSVSPSTCSLKPGSECTVTVTWHPSAHPSKSSRDATLTVTGPHGFRKVALHG